MDIWPNVIFRLKDDSKLGR